MDDGVQIKAWHTFSLDHALSASLLSRKCGELEAPLPGDLPPGTMTEHRSYATASVIASACFLEATINELFRTCGRKDLKSATGRGLLQPDERQQVADMADTVENLSTLNKFQMVLYLLGRPPFDRTRAPYSDAHLLMKLRNALVHYEPRLRPLEDEGQKTSDTQNLVGGLIGKFAPNPFYADVNNPFFPEQCLGHGCTSWAWRTARDFADTFFTQLGIQPVYEDARARLQP